MSAEDVKKKRFIFLKALLYSARRIMCMYSNGSLYYCLFIIIINNV